MDYQEIIAGTVGKENTFGTCVGRVKAGADELCALFHRRRPGRHPRLCRRRPLHRRSAEHLRRRRGGGDPPICRSCCATSARTGSNTTSPPTFAIGGGGARSRRRAIWAGTCIGTTPRSDRRAASSAGAPQRRFWRARPAALFRSRPSSLSSAGFRRRTLDEGRREDQLVFSGLSANGAPGGSSARGPGARPAAAKA